MSSWILVLFLVVNSVSAIFKRKVGPTVQDDWIAPAGPDNSTTLVVGEEYTIQWTASLWEWFSTYARSADVSNVDLWITGYYQHQYAHLIAGPQPPLFASVPLMIDRESASQSIHYISVASTSSQS